MAVTRYPLDRAYLEDPGLLMRPLMRSLLKEGVTPRFIIIYRQGKAETYDLQLEDRLELEQLLKDLTRADMLDTIVLEGYCKDGMVALIHIPSAAFYADGAATELGELFSKLQPLNDQGREMDQSSVTLWKERYDAALEL